MPPGTPGEHPGAGPHPGSEPPHESGAHLSESETARGTRSYEGDPVAFHGDPESPAGKRAVTEASRRFADDVRDQMAEDGVGRANKVRMAAALLTGEESAGTIHTHSSMRRINTGDGRPPVAERVHPEAQRVLDRILADAEADPDKRVGANHGKCAEVAVISDRLYELERQWHDEGSPGTFEAYARENFAGSQISTHWVGDGTRQEHGEYAPPCDSCAPMLDDFGIHPVDPSEVPPTPTHTEQPPLPPDRVGSLGGGVPLEDTRPYADQMDPPLPEHHEVLEAALQAALVAAGASASATPVAD